MIAKESMKEIAQWVYLNTVFLFQINDSLESNPKQSIADLYSAFLKDHSIPEFNFKNQGAIIALLEKVLFYIRECFSEREINDYSIHTRQKIVFKIGNSEMNNWTLLKNLRNSVAHGDYSVIPKINTYIFRNRDKFKIEIQHGDLGYLLTELGKKFLF